ncbi:hypothetical protein ACHWQZ_G003613 [Mnemiopsis leidyi]
MSSNSIPKDWFEQILSEVNGSNFNRDDIPDQFSVSIKDNDKEVANWDITEELRRTGLSKIHFTNATLNVDVQLLFMHEDIQDELVDNELFKNVINVAMNHTVGLKANISSIYVPSPLLESLSYAQGTLTLIIGLVGLIAKLKGPRKTRINTMIYLPFSFRQHKKALSKWVLNLSLFQSTGVFIALMAWAFSLVFGYKEDCLGMIARTYRWQTTIKVLMGVGYIGSLVLSFTFAVGFLKSAKTVEGSEKKNFKKTMIKCSIEIIYDMSALIAAEITSKLARVKVSDFLRPQLQGSGYSVHCYKSTRFYVLDGEIAECLLKVLALQPVVQETVLLITELVDYCL